MWKNIYLTPMQGREGYVLHRWSTIYNDEAVTPEKRIPKMTWLIPICQRKWNIISIPLVQLPEIEWQQCNCHWGDKCNSDHGHLIVSVIYQQGGWDVKPYINHVIKNWIIG